MQTINDNVKILGELAAKRIDGELSEDLKTIISAICAEIANAAMAPLTEAITELARRVDELQTQLTQAQAENAALVEKVNKNIIL